ncbi:hypothetical protein [Stenotrophomonas sp. SY1]|uniref:hypothetical protein n=1 Tax=Stenotrophomonas sp. SY1 TaxID=477235 RepID=UPI001E4AECA5|nr:hypothetical protein [Stenotrophomonas sp. SY1]MCD9088545.1 hypothetical protein [Stenotrophomonas sp. SY1]
MSDSTPVGLISTKLMGAGYRRMTDGLKIGSLSFEFDAAFVPEETSAELVVVADSAHDPEQSILRKIEGVARALDINRSTRSLTLVVTGPRPSDSSLVSMSRVCRVLPTGNIAGVDGEQVLENWIAVLLPLRLSFDSPAAPIASADGLFGTAHHLGEGVQKIVRAAHNGQSSVAEAMFEYIDSESSASMEGKP